MSENHTDDYAPFPEPELAALADHFENIGHAWAPTSSVGAKLRKECFDRAKVCRNAIKSFTALRERCLIAETGAAAAADGPSV